MFRIDHGHERSVSTVVGVVVLVGMVAMVSAGVVLLGGHATADSRQTVENERIRQAFVEFQTDVDTVARGDDDARTVSLDLPDDGDGAVREERSGRIVVERSNLSTTKTIVVQDVGAVVYENGDTQYAYQAGAVWRGEGNATQMVSAPDVTYATTTRGTDPTLTFPIVNLEGARRLGSDRIRIEDVGTGSPLSDVSTVDDQLVVVEIRSDYYVGWGRYFRSRYENTVVSYDHPNDTVVIELGTRSIDGDFDQAVYAMAGDYVDHHPAAGVDGEVAADGDVDGTADGTVQATGTFAELDPVIAGKVHRAETDPSYAQSVDVDDGTSLTSAPGGTTYYDDDGNQADFCIVKGNTAIEGAVVAGPVKIAQSTTIEYDPEAADTPPTLAHEGVLPPPITYLHVSVHAVEIDRR